MAVRVVRGTKDTLTTGEEESESCCVRLEIRPLAMHDVIKRSGICGSLRHYDFVLTAASNRNCRVCEVSKLSTHVLTYSTRWV